VVTVDEATRAEVVKSGAFIYNDDGCSVSRSARLAAANLSAEDLKLRDDDRIAAFKAVSARLTGFETIDDRWPNGPESRPADVAHALLLIWGNRKARERALTKLARASALQPD
jgi:hypothetical protein